MNNFTIRSAKISDVPFLVDTIIEAEKSGTNKLSYATIFGLSEKETRKYITEMLAEEIDGCELSISSFIIAEKNGQNAAAVSAWIEGIEGVPSTILKGNLLNYTLQKECIEKAKSLNNMLSELHIENFIDTIQLGLVYVSFDYRGMNLVGLLIDEVVLQLKKVNPLVKSMYVQVFGNNLPAIMAYKKTGFRIVKVVESTNKEILNYLPSDSKILMKKEV